MGRNPRKGVRLHTSWARSPQTVSTGPPSRTTLLPIMTMLVVMVAVVYLHYFGSDRNEPSLKPVPSFMTQLLNALIAKGNVSAVKSLLDSHPNLDWDSLNSDWSPIHLALQGRFESLSAQAHGLIGQHEEIIAYFTENRGWKPAGCPVYYAVYYRNMHALRLLLQAMGEEALACLTARDSTGMSALQVTASSKASGFARLFARLVSSDTHTIEQLHPAVADMLSLSEKPPILTSTGQLLMFASLDATILHTDLEIIVSHFGPRLNLSAIQDIWGNTMMHTAAYAGRQNLVEFLIKQKVPVNTRNVFGQTPGALANMAGHNDVLKLLAPGDEADFEVHVPHDCREKVGKTRLSQLAWDQYCTSGWTSCEQASGVLKQLPSCSCQLALIHAENLTAEQFSEVVVSWHMPVLLEGLTTHWPAWTNWRKQLLLKKFGHLLFTVATIPYSEQYSSFHDNFSRHTLTLEQYVDSFYQAGPTPVYVFDGNVLESSESLASNAPPLKVLSHRHVYLRQFILGPRNSGSPPHFHGQALNSLIYGIKQWFFWQPSSAFFSFKHVSSWKNEYNKLQFPPASFTCLQFPGDTVYVPENWGHAVVNMNDSIAVASEFT